MAKKNRGPQIKYRDERECWEVVEYIRGKLKRYATGYGSRQDAETKLAEIIIKRNTPKKNENQLTLGEIIAYYIQEHVPTVARQETALKCFDRLLPFWGDLKLEDIKKSKSLDYIEHRKKEFKAWQKDNDYKSERKLTKATIRREIEQLQAAIGYAYRDNLISVCPYVWKPDRPNSRTRWLTRKEAAALLRGARNNKRVNDYLPMFILIGLYTGARHEALLKLRWPHVDLVRGYMDFTANYSTKTKGGSKIPIPSKLLGHLRRHRKRGTEMGFVIHDNQTPIKSVKNSFASACLAAKLTDVTPHTLRHTAASWRVQKGVPISQVAKFLGHKSASMVERHYGHLEPEHLKEAAEAY